MRKRYVCPNNCGDWFSTVAHVVQDWKVDGLGNFVEVIDNPVVVTHGPTEDNIWTCVVCGEEAFTRADSEYEGAFEYGGYYFRPYRKYEARDGDFYDQMQRMKSDRVLCIATYKWGRCNYSHSDFYAKSGDCETDIFMCIENRKLYVPCENELFQYTEPN